MPDRRKEWCVDRWNTRASTQALSTLQTLLNQAAEALEGSLHANMHSIETVHASITKALAAIQPYLSTGDTNDR